MKTEQISYCGTTITLHDAQIIALHCKGHTRDEMCNLLGNTKNTLKNQISAIFKTTGARSASELIRQARDNGFDSNGLFHGRDLFGPPKKRDNDQGTSAAQIGL